MVLKLQSKTPNPGSDEAVLNGCTCAVLDNAHGRGSGYKDDDGNPTFWITADCPLHWVGAGGKDATGNTEGEEPNAEDES